MHYETIILFLSLAIATLLCIVIYQQVTFRHGLSHKLWEVERSLKKILDTISGEQVMAFTDCDALIALIAQIDRLLDDRQSLHVRYLRSEEASRKMLSNISHDIKTPLTVLLGHLEILRLRMPEEPALEKAERKAKQVMAMIDEFFTLAKLEAGDTDLPLGRIGINELCRQAVLDRYDLLTRQGFAVDLAISESTFFVWGNADAIERILSNLLSNALRYGSDGKYIGIALRTDEHFVYVDVADRGKGIEANAAGNVFDRLYTLEDSRSREVQGNGLGLTIAKNLAIRMDGELTFASTPNIKTVFTLKLKRLSY